MTLEDNFRIIQYYIGVIYFHLLLHIIMIAYLTAYEYTYRKYCRSSVSLIVLLQIIMFFSELKYLYIYMWYNVIRYYIFTCFHILLDVYQRMRIIIGIIQNR